MEVEISDLRSTVRAIDGEALLSPSTLESIVRVVLQAIDEREAHRSRVRDEERISTGINHDIYESEWISWSR
ncbi:MAG TPA: hypothetical protein VIX17_17425 [Pyrinomonadaceae bacterium]|jgi:hypothetical protein